MHLKGVVLAINKKTRFSNIQPVEFHFTQGRVWLREDNQEVNRLMDVAVSSYLGQKLQVTAKGDFVFMKHHVEKPIMRAWISPILLPDVIATRKATSIGSW